MWYDSGSVTPAVKARIQGITEAPAKIAGGPRLPGDTEGRGPGHTEARLQVRVGTEERPTQQPEHSEHGEEGRGGSGSYHGGDLALNGSSGFSSVESGQRATDPQDFGIDDRRAGGGDKGERRREAAVHRHSLDRLNAINDSLKKMCEVFLGTIQWSNLPRT